MLKQAPLIPELRRVTDNRFLIAWVWNLADDCPNPLESLIDYAACIGRTLSTEDAEIVIAEADSMERQRESLALSKWLGITKALCVKYQRQLKTICGCDTTPTDRRRESDKARKARKRFKAGILPGERAARAKTRRVEIAASGVSKSQWYRREKAKNDTMRLSVPLPSSFLLKQRGNRRELRVASQASLPATTRNVRNGHSKRRPRSGSWQQSAESSDERSPSLAPALRRHRAR
jgi:hypothetical protein